MNVKSVCIVVVVALCLVCASSVEAARNEPKSFLAKALHKVTNSQAWKKGMAAVKAHAASQVCVPSKTRYVSVCLPVCMWVGVCMRVSVLVSLLVALDRRALDGCPVSFSNSFFALFGLSLAALYIYMSLYLFVCVCVCVVCVYVCVCLAVSVDLSL
jgi:hypothetical protein